MLIVEGRANPTLNEHLSITYVSLKILNVCDPRNAFLEQADRLRDQSLLDFPHYLEYTEYLVFGTPPLFFRALI